jgi:pilus assembly protein Flp/PilA
MAHVHRLTEWNTRAGDPARVPFRGRGASAERRLVREEVNRNMIEFFHALRNREDGQALVEYGLILALVAVVCIGVLTALGTGVQGILQQIVDAL